MTKKVVSAGKFIGTTNVYYKGVEGRCTTKVWRAGGPPGGRIVCSIGKFAERHD